MFSSALNDSPRRAVPPRSEWPLSGVDSDVGDVPGPHRLAQSTKLTLAHPAHPAPSAVRCWHSRPPTLGHVCPLELEPPSASICSWPLPSSSFSILAQNTVLRAANTRRMRAERRPATLGVLASASASHETFRCFCLLTKTEVTLSPPAFGEQGRPWKASTRNVALSFSDMSSSRLGEISIRSRPSDATPAPLRHSSRPQPW